MYPISKLMRTVSDTSLSILIMASPSIVSAQTSQNSASTTTAESALPLAVENLITGRGITLLDLSISYSNIERSSVAFGDPLIIQAGPTSFITLPSAVGSREINNDTMVATAGLRHGITSRTEVYIRGSALHTSNRGTLLGQRFSGTESRFADAWFGASHQFADDERGPAVIGFLEVAAVERLRISTHSFRSGLLGFTVYKALDPVVLAGSVAFHYAAPRNDGPNRYNPGDILTIRPSVGFAANERINLTFGFQCMRSTSSRIDGHHTSFNHTSTDIILGAGYGLSGKSSFNFTIQANASGHNGADLRLNWLRPF
jgi:hypothetical protein